jgi:hypothetical protein
LRPCWLEHNHEERPRTNKVRGRQEPRSHHVEELQKSFFEIASRKPRSSSWPCASGRQSPRWLLLCERNLLAEPNQPR